MEDLSAIDKLSGLIQIKKKYEGLLNVIQEDDDEYDAQLNNDDIIHFSPGYFCGGHRC